MKSHLAFRHGVSVFVLLSALGMNSLGFCAEPGSSANDEGSSQAVALVKGRVVTLDEVTSFSELLQKTQGQMRVDPGTAMQDYVMMNLIGDAYTTLPQTDKALAQVPTSYKYPSQRIFLRTLLWDQVRQSTTVPQEALEKWYHEHVNDYITPERVWAYHLFMGSSKDNPSSAPEQVRQRMEKVKADADAGTSFGLLASRYSEASSSANGGEIGWVRFRAPIGPENRPMNLLLDQALFKLRSGQVSPILQTSYGLHLMYAREHQTTVTPTLADLVTSHILPEMAMRDQLTSAMQQMVDKSLRAHNAHLVQTSDTAELTTSTPAFVFDGKTWTVHDIELIYGPRFTAFYRSVANDPEQRNQLLTQVMQDEALVQAAVDMGIDKRPDVQRQLEQLASYTGLQKALGALMAQSYTANEQQARELYEKRKEQYRQPLAKGHIITLAIPEAKTPSEQAKARQETQAKAQQLVGKLRGGADFEAMARELSKDNRASSGGLVEMHVIGELADPAGRSFDNTVSSLQKPGEISEPHLYGESYVIARLDEQKPGEPRPFDAQMKSIMLRYAQQENQRKMRQDVLKTLEQKGLLKWLPGATQIGSGEGRF